MRKMLFIALISMFAFAACNDGAKYQINGKITDGDLNGKTVYLKKFKDLKPVDIIDSTVVKDGAFTLKGSVEHPDFYNITIAGSPMPLFLFVENSPIQVNIDANNPQNNVINGSPLNDLYTEFNKEMRASQDKMQDINKRAMEAAQLSGGNLTEEQEAEFYAEFGKIQEEQKAYQMKFMDENPNSIVSSLVLINIASGLEKAELEERLSKFDEIASKSIFVAKLKEDMELAKRVAVGQKFIDFKLPNTEGNEISLSDFAGKGKYVLIDFWASWCGPCRQENPNVVKLYEQFKDKGFEIVGVSLDRSKEDWIKGIEEDKITWPQMFDMTNQESIAAKAYAVQSIPSTILLDKEGVIIAKDLRGEELTAKITELLSAE